jgi:hypothetical protein
MIDYALMLKLAELNSIGKFPTKAHASGKIEHIEKFIPAIVKSGFPRSVAVNSG